jgi:hypothetical protein
VGSQDNSDPVSSPFPPLVNDTSSYERPYQFGPIPYTIDVLPLTTDCAAIPGDELCVALPGCIQCLNFHNNIRVLKVETVEEGDISHDDLYSHYYSNRNLYADIMPNLAGIPNINKGICRNGWRNRDCGTFVHDAGVSWTQIPFSFTQSNIIGIIISLFLFLI